MTFRIRRVQDDMRNGYLRSVVLAFISRADEDTLAAVEAACAAQRNRQLRKNIERQHRSPYTWSFAGRQPR